MNRFIQGLADPISVAAAATGSGTNAMIAAGTVAAGDPAWLTVLASVLAVATPILVGLVNRWIQGRTDADLAKIKAIEESAKVAITVAEAARVAAEAKVRELELAEAHRTGSQDAIPKVGG